MRKNSIKNIRINAEVQRELSPYYPAVKLKIQESIR